MSNEWGQQAAHKMDPDVRVAMELHGVPTDSESWPYTQVGLALSISVKCYINHNFREDRGL